MSKINGDYNSKVVADLTRNILQDTGDVNGMQRIAKSFYDDFAMFPTEVKLADWITEYIYDEDIFRVDDNRDIYVRRDGYPFVFRKEDHFDLSVVFNVLRAWILVDYQLKSISTDELQKISNKLNQFDTAGHHKNIEDLVKTKIKKYQMNNTRAICFRNGIAWNGTRFITDEKEITAMCLTQLCPYDIYPDFDEVLEKYPSSWQKVNSILLDFANNDSSNIDDLTALLGYIMTLGNRQKKFFMLYGPEANNGKTTFDQMIATALGDDLTAKLTTYALAQPKYISSQVFSDLVGADGKVMVYTSEPEKHMVLNVSVIKEMTGNDVLPLNQKYKNVSVRINTDFVPIMECNNIPKHNDDTLIRSGRLTIISFENKFDGRINPLKSWTDVDYSVLLSYMIQICIKTTESGRLFKWSNKYLKDYVRANDSVLAFVTDCTEKVADGSVSNNELYQRYIEFYDDNSNEFCERLGSRAFIQKIRVLGYSETRIRVDGKCLRGVAGIKLINPLL